MPEKSPGNDKVFEISVLWKGSKPINLMFQ